MEPLGGMMLFGLAWLMAYDEWPWETLDRWNRARALRRTERLGR